MGARFCKDLQLPLSHFEHSTAEGHLDRMGAVPPNPVDPLKLAEQILPALDRTFADKLRRRI